MSKKKDSLWSILFWLFFLVLIFWWDIVEFSGFWKQTDPTLYLLLLWWVIVFIVLAYKFKDLFRQFSSPRNENVSQSQNKTHNENFESILHSEQARTTAQTVTWEYVNPFSLNGK